MFHKQFPHQTTHSITNRGARHGDRPAAIVGEGATDTGGVHLGCAAVPKGRGHTDPLQQSRGDRMGGPEDGGGEGQEGREIK